MSRIAYGKHLLKLKNGQITVVQFLDGYTPLDDQTDFSQVEENDLGIHKDHEKAHAKVLSDVNIRFEYYLSSNSEISFTKANVLDLKVYASNLSSSEFLNFLTKLINPPVNNFQMGETDLFLYKILIGELDSIVKIENYIISLTIN